VDIFSETLSRVLRYLFDMWNVLKKIWTKLPNFFLLAQTQAQEHNIYHCVSIIYLSLYYLSIMYMLCSWLPQSKLFLVSQNVPSWFFARRANNDTYVHMSKGKKTFIWITDSIICEQGDQIERLLTLGTFVWKV
jgi:hypothetical protein